MSDDPSTMFRSWLSRSGIKQKDIAQDFGVSRAYISSVARGLKPISVKLADRLEFVTGIPALEWLSAQAREDLMKYRRVKGGRFMSDYKDKEIARLREALKWAVNEIDGKTRYDHAEQFDNCLARARKELEQKP